MARGNDNVFTIYDLMDKAGRFRSNPANRDSQDPQTRASLYKGPVMYPRMFFHPKGETRIMVPAEVVVTPFGPQKVGEQREILYKVAENAEEEAALRAAGWWDTPAKSIHAGGGEAPPVSSVERVVDLEAEIAALRAELLEAREGLGLNDGVESAGSTDAKMPPPAGNALASKLG